MPQYFLHLRHVATDIPDGEGAELRDVDEARAEAELAISELAAENIRERREFDLLGIRICDPDGNLFAEVSSRDVLASLISPAVIPI
jgi:hypothetical protein